MTANGDIRFWRRKRLALSCFLLAALLAGAGWVQWGHWPDPEPAAVSWAPEAIVVLGGGNSARSREAMRWHGKFPTVPVIVTGDGGLIRRELLEAGLPAHLLRHEDRAASTEENAEFVEPFLAGHQVSRFVVVSNWFHIPRAMAVFRKRYPECRIGSGFEVKPVPVSKWERASQRRERLAALWYLVRYGINSFSDEPINS